MGGFIRGARQDPRYAQRQAKELDALPGSTILTQPVDLQKINVSSLQGWLCWRIQELLGGVEDEILAGMIGNVLEEERMKLAKIKGPAGSIRSWSPKELQHTLGPFLSEEGARSFMEELWVLLLDAQSAPDGIPQAWGPAERAKFVEAFGSVVEESKKNLVLLGSSAPMRLRSPERLIGRLIEDVKEESRTLERRRYFDDARHHEGREYQVERRRAHRRDHERDERPREYYRRDEEYRTRGPSADLRSRRRGRSRSRSRGNSKLPSPQRTPNRQRDFSADTYSSASPSRSPSPVLSVRDGRSRLQSRSRSPARSRSRSRSSSGSCSSRSSRSRSRSRSPSRQRHKHRRKHRHHKKKHHKHKRHHRRSHSHSPSSSRSPVRNTDEMSHLERLLRQKALESVQQRHRD